MSTLFCPSVYFIPKMSSFLSICLLYSKNVYIFLSICLLYYSFLFWGWNSNISCMKSFARIKHFLSVSKISTLFQKCLHFFFHVSTVLWLGNPKGEKKAGRRPAILGVCIVMCFCQTYMLYDILLNAAAFFQKANKSCRKNLKYVW